MINKHKQEHPRSRGYYLIQGIDNYIISDTVFVVCLVDNTIVSYHLDKDGYVINIYIIIIRRAIVTIDWFV